MQEDKNRRKKALMGTVIFHVAMLLFFMFSGLTQPDPLPEEIGVEISLLGDGFTGSGETQPVKVAKQSNAPAPKPTPKATTSTTQPKVAEDPNSDISIKKAKLEEEKKKKEAEEKRRKEEVKEEPKPTVNKQALYPGKTDKTATEESGSSQGTKKGTGNMGSSDGKTDGKSVLGGEGFSVELSGRGLLKGPTIDDTDEEGIVVLNIWVDRYGNVVRMTNDLSRSTTTSENLVQKAKTAAAKTKFTQKGDAAAEQKGRMTFKFILR